MAGIWIFSEDKEIAKQLLGLASSMNETVSVLTLNAEEGPELIASGANRVCVLNGQGQSPESYAAAVAELAAKEDLTALLVGATARGKDFAAKVAALLKAGLVTEAFSVELQNGSVETKRMMYGGLAVCTEVVVKPALVTVPARTFEALPQDTGRSGEVIALDVTPDHRIAVVKVEPVVRQGADITTASKIVCVGRGLEEQSDMKLAEVLGEALGAEIGCTRSIAEDYHWLPPETYIGISGQRIKPELYVSLGVSGQVQHVAGIRDSKIIVAVDMNENAPIFEAADYGIVGDLREVAPLLTEAVKAAKG